MTPSATNNLLNKAARACNVLFFGMFLAELEIIEIYYLKSVSYTSYFRDFIAINSLIFD